MRPLRTGVAASKAVLSGGVPIAATLATADLSSSRRVKFRIDGKVSFRNLDPSQLEPQGYCPERWRLLRHGGSRALAQTQNRKVLSRKPEKRNPEPSIEN